MGLLPHLLFRLFTHWFIVSGGPIEGIKSALWGSAAGCQEPSEQQRHKGMDTVSLYIPSSFDVLQQIDESPSDLVRLDPCRTTCIGAVKQGVFCHDAQ